MQFARNLGSVNTALEFYDIVSDKMVYKVYNVIHYVRIETEWKYMFDVHFLIQAGACTKRHQKTNLNSLCSRLLLLNRLATMNAFTEQVVMHSWQYRETVIHAYASGYTWKVVPNLSLLSWNVSPH